MTLNQKQKYDLEEAKANMSSALNDTAYLPDGTSCPSPTRTPGRLPEIGERHSPSKVVLSKIDMSPSKVTDSIKLPDIPED